MTPDLQTQIRSDELTRKRAKEIAEASQIITDGFRVWDGFELGLLRRRPFLEVPELHDYLTDAADWNADTWDFEPEGRARLARTLGWLYGRLPEPFLFSATWGPATIDERDMDRAELLAVIDSNAVSTGTVHKVRAA
jgi:hypothetical protein